VNTIVVQGDRLVGHNTDAEGFMRALTQDAQFDPAGKEVVLLGAGGAALAVIVGLMNAGAGRIWIANRSEHRARTLADRLNGDLAVVPLTEDSLRTPLSRASLLVNSTSVGMSGGPAPGESPVSGALLGPHLLVYDLVYNPVRTPLLRAAAAAGGRTQEGLPMLIYQGAASFARWTGRPAPVQIMMEAGRRALREREQRNG
jgi:shikimate dehydrogenase